MDRGAGSRRVRLEAVLRRLERVVVAYSGGVDSSVLTAVAHEVLGAEALAVTAVSPSLARSELRAAEDLARARGWQPETVRTHEVQREAYARNGTDRCYWCKTELFEVLEPIAAARRATIVVGTNLDDTTDHRPGSVAAEERGVRSPLLEASLSKSDVRALARDMDLPTADKLASPCLSSRFAYGVRVTPAGLRRIEKAEEYVRSLGFDPIRVRDHGDHARVEVPKEDIPQAAALAPEIEASLGALGFRHVSLDLAGFRSGSLNEPIPAPTLRRRDP